MISLVFSKARGRGGLQNIYDVRGEIGINETALNNSTWALCNTLHFSGKFLNFKLILGIFLTREDKYVNFKCFDVTCFPRGIFQYFFGSEKSLNNFIQNPGAYI